MKKTLLFILIIILFSTGAVAHSQTLGGVLPPFYIDSSGNLNLRQAVLTRGELLIATTTSQFYQLATGTDGYVLTMSSGIPAWAAPTGGGGADTDWAVSGAGLVATTSISYVGPASDSAYDFGTSTAYWANAFVDKVYLDSDSTIVAADVDAWLKTVDISDNTNLGVTATGIELSDDDIALSDGYIIPLSASTTNWETAYTIVNSSSSDWDTAYSWGDHSLAGYITSTLTEEEVEDYVGGMVTGNTETLITVTYQDGDGTIDFVVNNDLSLFDNTTSSFITATDLSGYMEDTDIDTFTELQDWVSDATLVKVGTTTADKVCTWDNGNEVIHCESTAGADTFAGFEINGESQTNVAPTFDFDGTTFSIVEDPANDFDININKGSLTESTSSVLTITGGTSAILSNATIEVDTDLHNWNWANVVDADITNTLTCSTVSDADKGEITISSGAWTIDDDTDQTFANLTVTTNATSGSLVLTTGLTLPTAWTGILRADAGVVSTTTAGSGTVTSVDMSVPTGLTIDGNPITESGTLALTLTEGYVIPLTASTTNWETAYGWGDWSGEGFLTTVDISDNTNLAAGRSLTMSDDSVEADAELYTETKCVYWEDPTADDDFESLFYFESAATITRLWCESDQTVTMTIQEDDGSPADIETTDLTCDSSPANQTSGFEDAAIAAGSRIDFAVESVASTPTWCSFCFTFTYDD